jgi:methyl-accepting chemotaxis protein
MRLSSKIFFIVFVILTLFSIVIGSSVTYQVQKTISTANKEKANSDAILSLAAVDKEFPGEWRVEGDSLFKGATRVNSNTEIVDYIAKITGGTVSVYLKDVQIATNIVENDKRLIGNKAKASITKKTFENGEIYSGNVEFSKQTYQAVYQPIEDQYGKIIGMWYVGVSNELTESAVKEIVITMVISIFIVLILAILSIWIFTSKLKQRLEILAKAMRNAGKGDFSTPIDFKGKDEIALVAYSYEQMRRNLSDLVNQMKTTSEQLAASAAQLQASSDETSRAADSIAITVEEVAGSSEKQTDQAFALGEIMNEMVNNITSISENILTVHEYSANQASVANKGEKAVQKTKQQVEQINETNLAASEIIFYLGDKSKEIGSIINLISGIADQTNLLALNAAIEAARAGEHGKGFAVVAEEVRKLAEKSNQSASQIRFLIKEIQVGIEKSVQSMESGRTAIDKGLALSNDAERAFFEINQSVASLRDKIGTVSVVLDQLNLHTGKVSDVVDLTVTLIQQTSETTQNVVAATEEQNASMEEIGSSAQALTDLSEEMRDSLGKFTV